MRAFFFERGHCIFQDFSNMSNGPPVADASHVGAPSASGAPGTRRFSAMQDKLLTAGIQFFHRHIRTDNEVLRRMKTNEMFQLFFEPQYYDKKASGEKVNSVFINSVSDPSAMHVSSFILSILHQGLFSVSAFIVSIIYLSRFKESSQISLHASTWRPLFLTSLLIADKMWEDKPVRNSSLAKLFPVLSNAELNKMENKFLLKIRFNVQVKSDLFTSFCEKLLQENVSAEISRCVAASEYAAAFAEEDSVITHPPLQQHHAPPPPAPCAPTSVAHYEPVVEKGASTGMVSHCATAAQREPSRGPLGYITAPAMDYFMPSRPAMNATAAASSSVRSSSIPAGNGGGSLSSRIQQVPEGAYRSGGFMGGGGLPMSSRQYVPNSARFTQVGMAASQGRSTNGYDQRAMYQSQPMSGRGTLADPSTSRQAYPASTRTSLPAGLAGGYSYRAPSTPSGAAQTQPQYAVVNTPTGPQYVLLRPSAAPAAAINSYSGRSSTLSQEGAAPRRHSIAATATSQRISTPNGHVEGQPSSNGTIPFASSNGSVILPNGGPGGVTEGVTRGSAQNRPHSAPRTVGMYRKPLVIQQAAAVEAFMQRPSTPTGGYVRAPSPAMGEQSDQQYSLIRGRSPAMRTPGLVMPSGGPSAPHVLRGSFGVRHY
ncbi:hypothetical protein Pmar_PMAR003472 [Perkinsus marinus ATCC 50983]|uniref:Cyclin N-terminal domain-containing protein n=1 Tax=Perkinsus marinus (strain ATCC 50983 / TXsc) TaxID=423536 RepID=C5KHE7_PERM5|nr:hypothetical protein Pmar_PMAR003472 [Perkinsus marinus ATCC 50983]EER16009.1 hypothetical protein Pmar_PMAR003472 [Perkinsus marinus ATCC 50983]|eukprot:XP_002784213.1 hypothetical protein Pmar_PMAR003472 [Perkinsus marinus ATCC 50983]